MKVIYGIGRYDIKIKNCVLVLGVFDGVHAGHQALLKAAALRAEKIGGRVAVMTFDPHPVRVLRPDIKMPLIVSLEHRLHLLEKFGVYATLVVKFTKAFSRLSPQKFIANYLVNTVKPSDVFVGDDFRFGQNRSGSLEFFEEQGRIHGFNVRSVKPKKGTAGKISSTDIRRMISDGNLKGAEKQLGHPVAVMGRVVKGDSRGKELGFPTANLKFEDGLIPPVGVYATLIEINGKEYKSMTNVGQRPSFTPDDKRISVETHIFNFSRDIYGRTAIVKFRRKIRDEHTFPDQEAFVSQLKSDAKRAHVFLK